MIKIVSVNCALVAVCVSILQVEAASLHNPLGSLFDNAQNQFADVLSNVIQHGDEGLRHLEQGAAKIGSAIDTTLVNEVQKLKEKGKLFLQEAQDDNSSCSKLYDEGQTALAELVSIFGSCLLNQTRRANTDIHHLADVISTLQNTLPQEAQDVMRCFKSSDFRSIPSCITNALQDLSKLGITAAQAAHAVVEFATFYPRVKLCYQFAYFDFIRRNLFSLLNNTGLCAQSLIRGIM